MPLRKPKFWAPFSSVKLAIWLLAVIAALSILGSFIPQNQEPGFYIERFGHYGYQALLKTGLVDVYSSPWFILLIVLFSANLTVCLLNRFSLKARALGSVLSHASILIILSGALAGLFFGEKGLIKIREGEEVGSFASRNGKPVSLGFSVRLDKFIYNEHMDPREKLLVYALRKEICPHKDCKTVPDEAHQCLIAEVPAQAGMESDITDTSYRIKILRYLNDFVIDPTTKTASSRSARPNNPAIEVQLKDKAGQFSTFWVFARFPDIHQKMGSDLKFVYRWAGRRPKDFISKVTIFKAGKETARKDIRVNAPLRVNGYTLFQFNYDAENLEWSGLQVVKDPGVPLVYLGFILLMAGLVIIFYVNPLINPRKSHTTS